MSRSSGSFDVGALLGEAWRVLQANAVTLVVANLIVLVLVGLSNVIPFGIGPLLLMGPLQLGLYGIASRAVAGQRPEVGQVFDGFKEFLPAFMTGLLVGVFVGIGSVLCVLPGILVAILYLPVYLFILDGEKEFWAAMEASRVMVWNNIANWGILFLVIFGLNLAGAVLCGIGLLVSLPISLLLVTLAYNESRRGGGGMAEGV